MGNSPAHTGLEHLSYNDAPETVAPVEVGLLDPERLNRLALIFFDCDGVMTDGRVWVDAEGNEEKAFSVIDGHGIAMLREVGVKVGMITRSPRGIPTARARKLLFDIVHTGIQDKGAEVARLREELALDRDQIAFMGDDLPDLSAFAQVGLTIAPSNARPQVKAKATATTRAHGGHGAVREVCDAIIKARLARDGAP